MSSTSMTTRIIIWIIAVTFALSSLGISIAVIWQAMENRKDGTASQEEKKTLAGSKLENFTPVEKAEKIEVIDIKPGEGREVKVGDTITADYTGASAKNGIVFESSLDSGQAATFQLAEGNLIQGWIEGLPGMKEGGTRRIIIPAEKGYGATGSQDGSIPPNTDLVFDITLHGIGE